MRLKTLKLEAFRNHKTLELSFGKDNKITHIVGPNARGKTNILEAIYLLALTKSFRGTSQTDLIKWEHDYARVSAELESNRENFTLEVFIGNPPNPGRSLKKNNVKISSYKFIGNCQIVFFHPEDLNILYLGPDLRRKYIDVLNIQINPGYYRSLRAYKKILEQRNSLLKSIKEGFAGEENLNVWDQQLIEQGSIIMGERQKSLDFFNQKFSETYRKISKNDDRVEIKYKSYFEFETNIKESFASRLNNVRQRDISATVTTVGPHRDDFEISLNQKPIHVHASRGEYRSILLAMKLLELDFYKTKTGETPVLLLDDVFSELDTDRQKTLLENITDCQTILTATHLDDQILQYEHTHIGLKQHQEDKINHLIIKNATVVNR